MTLKHFDDLTAIDCALGELDADTIGRMVRAWMDGETVSYKNLASQRWEQKAHYNWHSNYHYRLAPKPLTKPSVDWSHVGAKLNWMATNDSGVTIMYADKPLQIAGWWRGYGIIVAKNYASFVPGTCDWKDSLVMRPGYEGE